MPAYRFLFTGFLVCLSALLIPSGLSAHSGPDKKQLKKIIREFLSDSLLKHASVGFVIQDLETGRRIYEVDADRSLVPASSQKIISTALALYVLGPDFRYQTPFMLRGTLTPDGTFHGDLLVLGSGDPSFASESMPGALNFEGIVQQIYESLKRKGITKLTGRIIVDQKFICDMPEKAEWLWYDLGNYYGAGCFGFNFMENQARISLRAAQQEGGICEIFRVQPEPLSALYLSRVKGLPFIGTSDVYVLGSSLQTRHEVHGVWKCCGQDTLMIRSALPDPAGLFESMLKAELIRKGIVILDTILESTDHGDTLLLHTSPALRDLVKRAMSKSVNLYCESFLHQLGFAWNGQTDRTKALQSLPEVFGSQQVDREGWVMEDASGLSPKNMIPASTMVEILHWIASQQELKDFWTLIPDSQGEGLLSKYLNIPKEKRMQLRLKSGSMERMRNFSGYLVQDEKPRYAICLMVNHYSGSGVLMNARIGNFFNELMKLRW